jgi:hypothetical protein
MGEGDDHALRLARQGQIRGRAEQGHQGCRRQSDQHHVWVLCFGQRLIGDRGGAERQRGGGHQVGLADPATAHEGGGVRACCGQFKRDQPVRVTADAAVCVIGCNGIEALLLGRRPEAAPCRLRCWLRGAGVRRSVEAHRYGCLGKAEKIAESLGQDGGSVHGHAFQE